MYGGKGPHCTQPPTPSHRFFPSVHPYKPNRNISLDLFYSEPEGILKNRFPHTISLDLGKVFKADKPHISYLELCREAKAKFRCLTQGDVADISWALDPSPIVVLGIPFSCHRNPHPASADLLPLPKRTS